MKTLADAVAARGREDQNNYLLLRLIGASLVVYGHAFPLAYPCCGKDLVSQWIGYRYSGDVGLHVFFTTGGFLVFASFDKGKNLGRFLKARALRLFPALVVCMALLTWVVGPLLTTRARMDYLAALQTRRYFFWNATLHRFVWELPGVFSTNRYGPSVNGNLWTLGTEARLYLLVALMGVLGIIGRRWVSNVVIGAMVLLALWSPEHMPLIGGHPAHLRLGAFFAVGALLYNNRSSVPLNGGVFGMLLAATMLSKGMPGFEFFGGAVIAYGALLFAYSRRVRLPSWIQDYSYGIYLYGWPIEKLLAHFWPGMRPYPMAILAMLGAWGMGALSWYFIEKPALLLKGLDFMGRARAMARGLGLGAGGADRPVEAGPGYCRAEENSSETDGQTVAARCGAGEGRLSAALVLYVPR